MLDRTRHRHWGDLQSLSGLATVERAAAAARAVARKSQIAPLRLELVRFFVLVFVLFCTVCVLKVMNSTGG